MKKIIIGVKFKKVGKTYLFDPKGQKFNKGDFVIVETTNGVEFAEVVVPNKEMEEENLVSPLKQSRKQNKEEEALKKAEKLAQKHNLDMNITEVEYTFDNTKLLFYFTADGRIDFRDLVKDLAAIYKTRIELRQIGVRDQVKKIGGNGICGRELCCCTFLDNFNTVSIKMAKEQNIALTPSKISGNCGRLMCCLRYEQNVYEEKLERLPKVGATVKVEDEGEGIVDSVETLKEKIRIKFKDNEGFYYKKYDAKDVKIIKDVETKQDEEIEDEELKKLEE